VFILHLCKILTSTRYPRPFLHHRYLKSLMYVYDDSKTAYDDMYMDSNLCAWKRDIQAAAGISRSPKVCTVHVSRVLTCYSMLAVPDYRDCCRGQGCPIESVPNLGLPGIH
jgi:hypothetical protein